MYKWILRADGVGVWHGAKRPTKKDVQKAGKNASERGWNGTMLDLFKDGVEVDSLHWESEE